MALWCKQDDVELLLKGIDTPHHDTADIDVQIGHAQDFADSHLRHVIAASTLNDWTDLLCPPLVKRCVAQIAAAYVLNRFYQQAFMAPKSDSAPLASQLYREATDILADIRDGRTMLADTTSASVPIGGSPIHRAESTLERKFTSGSSSVTGTMDNY